MIEIGIVFSIIFGISGWVIAYYQYSENRKAGQEIRSIPNTVLAGLEPILNGKLKNIRFKSIKDFLVTFAQKTNINDYLFDYKIEYSKEMKVDITSWEWTGVLKNLTIGNYSDIVVGIDIDSESVSINVLDFSIPKQYREKSIEDIDKEIESFFRSKFEQVATDLKIEFRERLDS